MTRWQVLEHVHNAEERFGSATTGASLRRRDVIRAVRAGLVESIGLVSLCDGDGYLLCTRRGEEILREAFRLTDKGRAEYERMTERRS